MGRVTSTTDAYAISAGAVVIFGGDVVVFGANVVVFSADVVVFTVVVVGFTVVVVAPAFAHDSPAMMYPALHSMSPQREILTVSGTSTYRALARTVGHAWMRPSAVWVHPTSSWPTATNLALQHASESRWKRMRVVGSEGSRPRARAKARRPAVSLATCSVNAARHVHGHRTTSVVLAGAEFRG